MWGIVHNIIRPAATGAAEAECSCGWHGPAAEFPEHVAKETRDRITDFVNFVDDEIQGGAFVWKDVDEHAVKWGFLTPARFVEAMRSLGFKKAS